MDKDCEVQVKLNVGLKAGLALVVQASVPVGPDVPPAAGVVQLTATVPDPPVATASGNVVLVE